MTAISSDELIDSLHTRVITSTICSAMRSMISWRGFFSLFITFRTNIRMRLYVLAMSRTRFRVNPRSIRMSIIYLSPYSFLYALHLYWSLAASVDKKIKCSFYIFEIVFHSSLWLKLSIFFSLALFSLEMHNKRGKKLVGKNLNVNRQFFKDVLCVTLLQEGVGSTNS